MYKQNLVLNNQKWLIYHKTQLKPSTKNYLEFFCRPGLNTRLGHTEDLKMALDTSLLNTQHYKVRIKGKVEQSRKMSRALTNTSV